MTRAQGSRIWDVDGNEYIDFHSSFGAVLLGHNDPRINAAVRPGDGRARRLVLVRQPARGRARRAARHDDPVGRAGRLQLHRHGGDVSTPSGWPAASPAASGSSSSRATTTAGTTTWPGATTSRPTRAAALPTPVAASAGIPAAVRDLVEVREYNDAAGVRELLAREGDTIAAVIVEPVFHNAGAVAARAGLPRGAPRGLHGGRHAAHLRRGDHRLPPRSGRRPGPVRGDTGSHDDGQGHRQRLPDLGPGRAGRDHGPPRPEGRRALRRHVRGPDPQLRGRARGHPDRPGGVDPRAPDPARRPPDVGHPGGHRRDRRPGAGPVDRRRLDGLLHGRADPPLPRLRPLRDGQEPPGPARLPQLAARARDLRPSRTT